MEDDKYKFKKEFILRLIRFSISIIKFTEELRKDGISYSIVDQLIRCSSSVGANVVEAKSSHSQKDYIKYFEIALKSANETKYWLAIILELKPEFKIKTSVLINENIEIANIIASSVITMKNKRKDK